MPDNPADASLLDQARARFDARNQPPNAAIDTLGEAPDEPAKSRADVIAARVESIVAWWAKTAERDAATTAPKSIEYGSSDLAIMGTAMEGLFPGIEHRPPEEREAIGLEMAVAFYTLGKAARLFGAYERGELPGDDSWYDLTVYSLMARRIRDVGYWV